jgi:hypothetical protein
MKQSDAPGKLFRLKPDRSSLNYDGKTVEFLYDLDGRLLLLTGHFVVRLRPQPDIRYTGRLNPHDPPGSDYWFHLSEAHLRSTVPAKPGSQVDYLMEKPLLARECAKLETWDQTATSPVK